MKKYFCFILLLLIFLVGCNDIEENLQESIIIFNDLIYLDINEGISVPIEFENIDQERIILTFSNESILKYDPSDISIVGKKYGYSKIDVSVIDSDFFGTIHVYVQAKEVKNPKFVPSNNIVTVGMPFTFFLEDMEKVGAARENFDFYLSDEELAAINDNYIIHPLKAGILTVTAKLKTNPNVTTSFDVRIEEDYVSNRYIITTENNKYVIKPGERLKIYVDGETKTILDKFEYKSYRNNIASIADDGTVIGTKPGVAYFSVLNRVTNKTGYFYILVDGNENKVDYKEKLIEMAMGELGTKEVNNYTKYGDWYLIGFASYDWCQMFVSWCANQAGIPTSVIPRASGVVQSKDFFESKGRFKYKENYTPKRGDLIIFLNNASHIGIVTDVRDGRVYTVEGNTSNMVAERSYPLDYHTITGYCIPDYESLNF